MRLPNYAGGYTPGSFYKDANNDPVTLSDVLDGLRDAYLERGEALQVLTRSRDGWEADANRHAVNSRDYQQRAEAAEAANRALREALDQIDHEAKDNDVPLDNAEVHRVFDRICTIIDKALPTTAAALAYETACAAAGVQAYEHHPRGS